ncbi:hypothetical protein ACFXJ5_21560 [Streptomyces sp. NPDC059373]
MLHTVLRRGSSGESGEQIQPDLIIPTATRKGQSPSVASTCRALADHEKARTYPAVIEVGHVVHDQDRAGVAQLLDDIARAYASVTTRRVRRSWTSNDGV